MVGFWQSVREDIASVFESDPAARSYLEVVLCYPGLHAVWAYRIYHWFWIHNFRLLARWLSQVARFFTGIEIHPGAQIGRRLFIDHGMGVVIGNDVVIGTGAKVLGNITVGNNCRVGAGSVVLRSIPENSTIVGVPGHIVLRNGKRVVISDPKEISDPLSDVFARLAAEVHQIREQLQRHTKASLPPEPVLTIDEEWDTYSDGAGI